ncbi:MAG: hypothetical protein IPN69_14825 [Acidobacteria bacterium]|nr:hypothetical protein [Acidobacteriota bacterium]
MSRIKYLTTNASPKNARPGCGSATAGVELGERLFQSVQKKQNATTQNGSPSSGSSELKIWINAANNETT